MDEHDHIPRYLVFMITQILENWMSSIFYYASYLAEVVHNGLIGINMGKVDKPFCWYYLLMYICLYKGLFVFSEDTKLELEKDGEKLPVQL